MQIKARKKIPRKSAPVQVHHYATVTTTSPLTVTLDTSGVALPAMRHASYTPVTGHKVVVARIGSRLVVQDRVIA